MKICVYGASSNAIDATYLSAGEELGRLLVQRGHSLVFGAGATGMMGAVARGVNGCGGTILGISPGFFNVDGVLYDACTEMIFTDTMRQRKELLEQKSDGFIMSPGGIGTYEEFFEIFTLKQLGLLEKPIVILNTNGCYDLLLQMLRKAAEEKFMQSACLDLFYVAQTPTQALDYLERYTEDRKSLKELKYIQEEQK